MLAGGIFGLQKPILPSWANFATVRALRAMVLYPKRDSEIPQ